MSQNSINLSGTLEFVSWKPAGSPTKSGGTYKWARLSIRLSFQPVPVFMNGQQCMLDAQKIWVSVGVPYVRGGQQQTPDENKIQQLIQGKETGAGGNVLLVDGTFHMWGNPPKAEIKSQFNNLLRGQQPLANLNRCVLEGQVHMQEGQWLYINERYMIPGRKPGEKSTWKDRIIPVFLQSPIQLLPAKHRVLVFGSLSSQAFAWDGTQYQKQEFVHVIAEEVHACL